MQRTGELSESEMAFRRKRGQNTMAAINNILGNDLGPTSLKETPTIALVISGGGYRAISTSCGAMEALMQNKLLDALMYCVGLSGSVWYLSSTYTRRSFSDIKQLKKDHDLIRDCLGKYIEFGALTVIKYVFKAIFSIRKMSLTDVLGTALRDVLLEEEHKEATLSSLREYVETADVPLPIFSAASVRNKCPVIDFWEELELTPFEATYASYRLVIPIEHINSYWKNGVLKEVGDEPALHYIMGFCGSAFSILLLHLTDKHERKKKQFWYFCDHMLRGIWKAAKWDFIPDEFEESSHLFSRHEVVSSPRGLEEGPESGPSTLPPVESLPNESFRNLSLETDKSLSHVSEESSEMEASSSAPPEEIMSKKAFEVSVWNEYMKNALSKEGEELTLDEAYQLYLDYMSSEDWDFIDYNMKELSSDKIMGLLRNIGPVRRTGFLCNPIYKMSGTIEKYMMNNRPISEKSPDALDRIGEKLRTDKSKILVVDSGLGCNVPAIHVARPQRKVDIILVVDCETKTTDKDSDDFLGTLKDVQRQMRDNNMTFPPIDIEKLKQDPEREYYLFEDPDDPDCPVVIWFTLYNVRFRNLVNAPRSENYPPGDDGKRFNDFDVTPDREEYDTTNLRYSKRDVDRLRELMRFNIGENIEIIKAKIAQKVVHLRSKSW